jgi:hypothetical protein
MAIKTYATRVIYPMQVDTPMPPKNIEDEKRESTSLKIRPSIWKEAKIESIRQDMELSEFVEAAVLELIKKYQREKKVE